MTTEQDQPTVRPGNTTPHGATAPNGAPHAPASHPEGSHGGGDASTHGASGHGAEAEELGPVDFGAWAAGIVGVAAALLVAACFALATAPITH